MAETKTKPTRKSPIKFIRSVTPLWKRDDCLLLLALMEKITQEKPVLWGENIVGYGRYKYYQRSGQECQWPLTGFSPRKQNISIYIMPGFSAYLSQLSRLGKHKHSVSCLYISKLEHINTDVLEEIIADSVQLMRQRYG